MVGQGLRARRLWRMRTNTSISRRWEWYHWTDGTQFVILFWNRNGQQNDDTFQPLFHSSTSLILVYRCPSRLSYCRLDLSLLHQKCEVILWPLLSPVCHRLSICGILSWIVVCDVISHRCYNSGVIYWCSIHHYESTGMLWASRVMQLKCVIFPYVF